MTALLACLASLLTACLPTRQRYLQIEVPEAVYLPGACNSSGPRYWSYFTMNGIFVSLNLSTRLFGIHYPKATTVQLDSNELIGTGFARRPSGDVADITHAHQTLRTLGPPS